MFVREEVRVSAPADLVRARIATALHARHPLTVAAETALGGGRPDLQHGESLDRAPQVTVQAVVFPQDRTTVVAMRAFSTADADLIQPTLDVNLEIEAAAEETTRLILEGIVRPFRASEADIDVDGLSEELRAAALLFLQELAAALAAAKGVASVDP